MIATLYPYRLCCFIFMASLYTTIFWPGLMMSDSFAIYVEAQTGVFSDHHPPLMGYVWRFFLNFFSGFGSMLLLQLGLLWGASYHLSSACGPHWTWIFALFLPFYPGTIGFSGYILKDIHFSHGFAFVVCLLIAQGVKGKRLSIGGLMSVVALLLYASSVKYQARFVLPVVVAWLVLHQTGYQGLMPQSSSVSKWKGFFSTWKGKILLIFLGSTLGILSVDRINRTLVPPQQQNHSWECVKLYDLSGMSVRTGHFLLPSFMKRRAEIDVQDIKRHYDYLWEPLIVDESSPLRRPRSAQERTILLNYWYAAVRQYPLAYFQHRLWLWIKVMQQNSLYGPVKRLIEGPQPGRSIFYTLTEGEENHLTAASYAPSFSLPSWTLSLTYIFSYGPWIPILLIYGFVAIQSMRYANGRQRNSSLTIQKTEEESCVIIAFALLGSVILSLTLPIFLFVFSLAATPRYVYFSQIFLAISHILAGCLWLRIKENSKQSSFRNQNT